MTAKKDEFGLATVKNSMALKAKGFLDGIHKELIEEEQDTLKDFVKGAYRLVMEKEKESENLLKQAKMIREAIEKATKGDWDELSKIQIPARFFREETLRKHGKSLLSGSTEVRFVDLYVDHEEE